MNDNKWIAIFGDNEAKVRKSEVIQTIIVYLPLKRSWAVNITLKNRKEYTIKHLFQGPTAEEMARRFIEEEFGS
jgi:hypothetical protein